MCPENLPWLEQRNESPKQFPYVTSQEPASLRSLHSGASELKGFRLVVHGCENFFWQYKNKNKNNKI